MSAAATGGSLPRLRAGMIWRVGCTQGSFLNSGSRAGFGRVGCGLGGSEGFSAGFGESDKLNLLSLKSPAGSGRRLDRFNTMSQLR